MSWSKTTKDALLRAAVMPTASSAEWSSRISVAHHVVVTLRLKFVAGKTFRRAAGTSYTVDSPPGGAELAPARLAVSERGTLPRPYQTAATDEMEANRLEEVVIFDLGYRRKMEAKQFRRVCR